MGVGMACGHPNPQVPFGELILVTNGQLALSWWVFSLCIQRGQALCGWTTWVGTCTLVAGA